MKTIVLNLPDNSPVDESFAKMTLAAALYNKGKLTLGQAAELVGLSKRTFMELLAQYDTAVINYPGEELSTDLKNAKDYSL